MDLSSTKHSPSIFSLAAAICPKEKKRKGLKTCQNEKKMMILRMCQLAHSSNFAWFCNLDFILLKFCSI